ncbi:MAG: hypothetical protein ACFLMY_17695 [Candidatus Brachytrichaceae bacterium NZ_4S206]|jgi:hypothetical protein
MNIQRLVIGLFKIAGQLGTTMNFLISAMLIHVVLSSTTLMSSEAGRGWLVIGIAGLVISSWAAIGTAYYDKFAESSKLSKLMAIISAMMGVLMTAWLSAPLSQ